ncbi:hypothetical protein EZV62_027931 [Acer yangbiense]|uniref:Uncharacterized protein n=1 Tax=Acer yangbiense TaxID=1000413 RepID=A0A5C7GP16_9ROSI|nr:hypothetical protein EZV62_027931 [Acer yangbiense]
MSLPEGMKQKNVHLESLEIEGNHSLSFMTRGQLPSSLKQLRLIECEKLQYVFADADETHTSSSYSVIHEKNINDFNTFLESMSVISCPSLMYLSTRDQLPTTLRYLYINNCAMITTLSRGQLPDSLQDLSIYSCPTLESITERFHNSMLLETITISNCENFESIPEGIHKLRRLREIGIYRCPSLVCFPEEGLPSTNLRDFNIDDCKNLKALPRGMQTLNFLRIWSCPSIKSFPEECFPTKLRKLEIGNLDMYEQIIQWGLPNLTSLTSLQIHEFPDVESFEIVKVLPTSLTHLIISQFPKLKYISSYGFQNLTSLVSFYIEDCPNLISFLKKGLPSSLMELHIYDCPLLRKRCRRDKDAFVRSCLCDLFEDGHDTMQIKGHIFVDLVISLMSKSCLSQSQITDTVIVSVYKYNSFGPGLFSAGVHSLGGILSKFTFGEGNCVTDYLANIGGRIKFTA